MPRASSGPMMSGTTRANSSPPSRATVARPLLAHQALGDLAQQAVTRVVTQGVVDLFEAVEVQQGNRRLARVGNGACRAIEEQGPVGETGQQVVRSLVPLALGLEAELLD